MAQRSIEIVIGRLVTDEAFREAFAADRVRALRTFTDAGYDLTPLEIAALLATPSALWQQVAEHIDPRLQKASLVKEEL